MDTSGERENAASKRIGFIPPVVAILYFLASSAWIVGSDTLAVRMANSVEQLRLIQTYKGEAFVALSALAIFVLLKLALRQVSHAFDIAAASESRLRMALCSAGGGAWELDLKDYNGRFAFMSPALLARLGLPPDHVFTIDDLRAMRHPDDTARVEELLREAVAPQGTKTFDAQYRIIGRDGRETWVHSRGAVALDAAGRPAKVYGISLDVTDKVEAERRIHDLINFDSHTGLLKPAAFYGAVDRRIAAEAGRELAILQVKLGGATSLIGEGETLEASRLMSRLARRLLRLPSRSFTASLLAPDIIAVATAPTANGVSLEALCRRVVDLIGRPMRIDGETVALQVEAGAAAFPRHGSTAAQVCRRAGLALASTRAAGAGGLVWFTDDLDSAARLAHQRAQDLAVAVDKGQIECRFQPLVRLSTGEPVGFEALARWRRPGEGLVPPAEFIGLAEQRGLIGRIGEAVMRDACKTAAGWCDAAGATPFVAVNVSPHQLCDPGFPHMVERVLAETGLPPNRLELELTESALTGDIDRISAVLGQVRRLGVQLAIDDFGTGYSSLSLLTRLPFTRLKIDRSFVQACEISAEAEHVVRAIVGLARHLGLETTVEGIETEAQLGRFRAEGVDVAQGYFFGKAGSADEAAELLTRAARPAVQHRALAHSAMRIRKAAAGA